MFSFVGKSFWAGGLLCLEDHILIFFFSFPPTKKGENEKQKKLEIVALEHGALMQLP